MREYRGRGLLDRAAGVSLRAASRALWPNTFRNSFRGAFPEELKKTEGDPESYKVSEENATSQMAVPSQRASVSRETI